MVLLACIRIDTLPWVFRSDSTSSGRIDTMFPSPLRTTWPYPGSLAGVHRRLLGHNTATSGTAHGVEGVTDKSGYHYGVLGWSLDYIGVLGRSDDANSGGLFGYNAAGGNALFANGEAEIVGALTVYDSVSISKTGVSVSLGSSQTIAGGRTRMQVQFDTVNTMISGDGGVTRTRSPRTGTTPSTAYSPGRR